MGRRQPQRQKAAVFYLTDVDVGTRFRNSSRRRGSGGKQIVIDVGVSLAQPDFTSEILQAKNAGAEVVYIGLEEAACQRFFDAARRQNYKPIWMSAACMIRPILRAKDITTNRLYGGSSFGRSDGGSPEAKEWQEAYRRFEPDLPYPDAFLFTWLAGKLFEAAVKAGGGVTSKQILAGLHKLKNETLGGLIPPQSWPPGPHPEGSCGRVDKFNGTRFEPAARASSAARGNSKATRGRAAARFCSPWPPRRPARRPPTTRTPVTTSSVPPALADGITARFVLGTSSRSKSSWPCRRCRPKPASEIGRSDALAVLPDPGDLVLGLPGTLAALPGVAGLPDYPAVSRADYPTTPEDNLSLAPDAGLGALRLHAEAQRAPALGRAFIGDFVDTSAWCRCLSVGISPSRSRGASIRSRYESVATSTVSDMRLLGGLLRIAQITCTVTRASTTARSPRRRTTPSRSGVALAGMPVGIDENGFTSRWGPRRWPRSSRRWPRR